MKSEDEGEFRWLEIDLSDIFFLVRKHWVLVFFVPLFLATVGVAVAKFVLPPVFAAKTVFFIRPNFDQDLQVLNTNAKLDDGDSLRSIAEAMITDTVILRMIDNLDLRNDPDYLPGVEEPLSDIEIIEEVRDRYSTELRPTTRLVELIVEDYDPVRTVEISRELTRCFLAHMSEERLAYEELVRATLVTQADEALKRALESEDKLKAFRTEHPDAFVEQDSNMFHKRVLERNTSLTEARAEISRLSGVITALKDVDPNQDPHRVFQVLNQKDNQYLGELLTLEAAARAQLAMAGKEFTERHPRYRTALARVDDVDQSVRKYAAELKDATVSEYLSARERGKSLEKELAQLQEGFVEFKSASAEFRGLKEETDRNWNTHSQLQTRIMNLDLDPEVPPSFMTTASHPLIPNEKSKPRTLFWAAGGGFLGCLLAVTGVWWRNRNGLPFTSRRQSREVLGIPQAGVISIEKHFKSEQSITALENSSSLREVMIAAREAKIIHLTAPGTLESASFFSRALARGSSKNGVKTLLIALASQKSSGTVQPVTKSFSMMTLGTGILLEKDSFQRGLKTLGNQFDRVVIDTSAIPELAAKLAVARHCGKTIVTVEGGSGEVRGAYREFVQTLQAGGVHSIDSVYLEWEKGETSTIGTNGTENETLTSRATPRLHTASSSNVFEN